jgi:hypothetical protein
LPATVSTGSAVVGEPLCEQIDKILGHDCNVTDPGVCLNIMCNINLAGVEDIQVTDKRERAQRRPSLNPVVLAVA